MEKLIQKNIHTCIAYDQKLVAEGIAGILSKHKRIVVQGLFINKPEEVTDGVNRYKPELLLFESSYIFPRTLELLKSIRQSFPEVKLLVVSGTISQSMLNDLMQVINGYLLRTCDTDKLLMAVKEVVVSGKYLCPQLINTLFNNSESPNHVKQVLSSREKEIFMMWFHLEDISKISSRLNISKSTVRTHLKNIRDKLGKPGAVKMIFYACQESRLNGDHHPVCPFCKSYCTDLGWHELNAFTNTVAR